MERDHVVRHESAASKLEERVIFFLVFMGALGLTYGFLVLVDFLPEKPGQEGGTTEEIIPSADETEVATVEPLAPVDPFPLSITFDSLTGREVSILNPNTDSASVLDEALLKGVVRHPGSADFETPGTIFLLGHSSYLPQVMNRNFQAFNGIQKLKWGDTIRLRSSDTEYTYRVEKVYEAKATDAEVDIEWGTPKLVLATCNSFATKDDRFIVESVLVDTRPIDG